MASNIWYEVDHYRVLVWRNVNIAPCVYERLTEEEAAAFARKKLAEGNRVAVEQVRYMQGWKG